jgi:DNA recombination protein RmuC
MDELRGARTESAGAAKSTREELRGAFEQFKGDVSGRIGAETLMQKNQLDSFAQQLVQMTQLNEQRMSAMRETLEKGLKELRDDNSQKLEQMRATVDEKLHETLEKRLGESFALVSQRLEQVHQGLGEMQNLAAGVGDLKRVLTNVKTRGTFGEVQLGALLAEVLVPGEQYAENVATRPGSGERVEFAVKLPGPDAGQGDALWLPIDAKFPQEDYQRLVEAQEQADPAAAAVAGKQLETRLKAEAKDIQTKYLEPPHTTPFGILFLPTEGLFAEVVRRPGLAETLRRDHQVMVAGPTTLLALLNSFQIGFRTLAIQKRSNEVWTLLGAVKTEFGKFGDALA